MFFDSHAHISSDELFTDKEGLMQRAKKASVSYIVNICTDEKTLLQGIELQRSYPEVLLTGATTPHDVEKEGEKFFPLFAQYAREKRFVAIGETGLDYHYEHSPKDLQKRFLEKYLQLAEDLQLPVIFHCRDAFEDLFAIAKGVPYAILHCFTGKEKEAEEALSRGWMISFSGIVTFKKSAELREVAKQVPLQQMLVETDAPYLAPQSRRGKINEPSFIVETAQLLAKLKEVDVESFAQTTSDNAKKIFQLS